MSAAGQSAAAAVVALAVSACATPALVAGVPRVVPRIEIAPYAMLEECARLTPGDRLDYRYDSSEPVDFDIHYHEDNASLAPVVREQSTTDSGTFEARIAQDYCLLWQAGPSGAIIAYRVLLRRATP